MRMCDYNGNASVKWGIMFDMGRYELIEGDLLMTPTPVTKHQRILRDLGF